MIGNGAQTISDTTGGGMGPYGNSTILVNTTGSVTASTSFGAGYLTLLAGTFNGGTGTITLNNDFNQSGGTFNSTSGTFAVEGNFTITGSPAFNSNGGTVEFALPNNVNAATVTPGSISFNNVTFGSGEWTNLTISGTMNVLGNLTESLSNYENSATLYGGTIAMIGNGTQTVSDTTGAGMGSNGTTTILVNTTGSVTASSTFGAGYLVVQAGTLNLNGHNLTVNNDITIDGTITSGAGSITAGGSWTNNGTFLPGTATVTFNDSSGESPYTIGVRSFFFCFELV